MLSSKEDSLLWTVTWPVVLMLILVGCNINDRKSSASPEQSLAATPVSQPTSLSQTASSNDAALIRAGRSVGALQLGDTRARVFELLGKKDEDEEYSYREPCARTEIHWLDLDRVSNGLFIYLKEGRIFQIEADTPRYRTADGITNDSLPEDVRRHYPQLQAYTLLNSGAKVKGGRDLIYWIDRQSGIAFELYYNPKANKRRVSKIIVFEAGSDLQPEGCISPPQALRKLEPFALESPSNARKAK